MFSNTSKYAIRAVLYLSLYASEDKKFSPTEIAEKVNIPGPFLAKTLQVLTKRHLVSSTKGRHGGFYMSKQNRSNTLIRIVESIDGLDKFHMCALGLPVCSNEQPCPIHHLIVPVRTKFIEELTIKTIEELTDELRAGRTHIV
jgi:Rrf2 family protein